MWEQDEDYYGGNSYAPSYTPYSGRTSYKGGRSTWSRSSWSSYSFSTVFEDDDRDLMVKDPVSYITPTKIEIKRKVRVFKQEGVDLIKELSRVCYFKMLDEKNYLPEHLEDWDNLDDDTKAKHNSKKELFDSIYDKYIPGFTPLEQAIAIFLELQRQNVNEDGEHIEDSDLKLTPSFGFNREMYNDPTINEQLNYNELSKDKKMDIMNKISIIGDLGTQFKVEKEVDEKIVSNSDQFSKKIMRDYSQITMIDLYQRVFPNYRTKLATKDLMVNVPVERKEQKQKIIIMLDFSGSMDEEQKQIWVNAILIDRFRYVMKGEAEVFFSYFVSDTSTLQFHHITNREEVIAFWQMFSNSPNGGTTRVGSMVDHVAKEILTHHKLHNLEVDLSEEKPEILIINDGQDSIDSDKFPYKVNAICLYEQNTQLRNLCMETGGKQVDIEDGQLITAYSKEGGKQIISK